MGGPSQEFCPNYSILNGDVIGIKISGRYREDVCSSWGAWPLREVPLSGVARGGARGARAPPLAPDLVYIYVELTFRNDKPMAKTGYISFRQPFTLHVYTSTGACRPKFTVGGCGQPMRLGRAEPRPAPAIYTLYI